MVSQLGFAVLFGVLVVHTLLAVRAYRLRHERRPDADADASGADTGADAEATTVDADGDVVRCPECGTENEAGYRYCQACVAELPGARNFREGASSPLGRLAR